MNPELRPFFKEWEWKLLEIIENSGKDSENIIQEVEDEDFNKF